LECGLPVTVHVACMNSLLQNKADVKLLQTNGTIVQNTFKGEQDVLKFVKYHMTSSVLDQPNTCSITRSRGSAW
jgi:Plant protein of unknown function